MEEAKLKNSKVDHKKNATKSDEFELTRSQQNKLKKRLTSVYNDIIEEQKPKIDVTIQEDIRLAVNSGKKELFDLGCIVAMTAIKPYYLALAIKYQNPPNITVEDLLNAPLYEVVRENIKNYNAKYSLVTYFERYLRHAFMSARIECLGGEWSKYYMDTNVIVKRAEEELEAEGLYDVSAPDLSKWIEINLNKDISATTILKLREMNMPVISLDGMERQFTDIKADDPAKIYEEKERLEDFYKSINELDEFYAKFFRVALEYIEETGEIPETETQAFNICKKFMKKVTKPQAGRIMKNAFKEYARRNREKDGKASKLRGMRIIEDIQIMDEENSLFKNTAKLTNERYQIEEEIVVDVME